MHRRLSLSIVMLIVLLVAPFGRMAAADAMAATHHSPPSAMAGHCSDMPAPDRGPADGGAMTVDCLAACATVAAPDAPALAAAVEPVALAPALAAPRAFIGIHPEADPPPPRRS